MRTVCHQSLTVPNLYFPVPPQSVRGKTQPRTEHVAVAAGVRFEGYLDETPLWADGSMLAAAMSSHATVNWVALATGEFFEGLVGS